MRILFFGNNYVGWRIAEWLRVQGEQIVGLVLHPPERRAFGSQILQSVGVDAGQVFDGAQLRSAATCAAIQALRPDIGVSALFGYILQPDMLELLPDGCVNIHPALLPYNRGAYPNVWSIVEGTPAGVTLHYMDAGVDTGDIIAQRAVLVEPVDTGESLYRKLEHAAIELFQATWPAIRAGRAPRMAQPPDEGTLHRTRDVARIDEIDLERMYTARELIDIIRARTFPPYAGGYVRHEGRKVYLRLQLCYEEQPEHEQADNERTL